MRRPGPSSWGRHPCRLPSRFALFFHFLMLEDFVILQSCRNIENLSDVSLTDRKGEDSKRYEIEATAVLRAKNEQQTQHSKHWPQKHCLVWGVDESHNNMFGKREAGSAGDWERGATLAIISWTRKQLTIWRCKSRTDQKLMKKHLIWINLIIFQPTSNQSCLYNHAWYNCRASHTGDARRVMLVV
jgi:hypothetical protein